MRALRLPMLLMILVVLFLAALLGGRLGWFGDEGKAGDGGGGEKQKSAQQQADKQPSEQPDKQPSEQPDKQPSEQPDKQPDEQPPAPGPAASGQDQDSPSQIDAMRGRCTAVSEALDAGQIARAWQLLEEGEAAGVPRRCRAGGRAPGSRPRRPWSRRFWT